MSPPLAERVGPSESGNGWPEEAPGRAPVRSGQAELRSDQAEFRSGRARLGPRPPAAGVRPGRRRRPWTVTASSAGRTPLPGCRRDGPWHPAGNSGHSSAHSGLGAASPRGRRRLFLPGRRRRGGGGAPAAGRKTRSLGRETFRRGRWTGAHGRSNSMTLGAGRARRAPRGRRPRAGGPRRGRRGPRRARGRARGGRRLHPHRRDLHRRAPAARRRRFRVPARGAAGRRDGGAGDGEALNHWLLSRQPARSAWQSCRSCHSGRACCRCCSFAFAPR